MAWKTGDNDRNKLSDAQNLKTKIDQLRVEAKKAERAGNPDRAGELIHGEIPKLEKQLKEIEAAEAQGATVKEEVDADQIATVVSRWTGIPVDKMLEEEKEKLLHMEEQLGKRVIGQAEAVKAVSTAVRRARAGLQDPHRPIGSFMFLGPTGVGKTELTKALAEYLFDDETALIRVDLRRLHGPLALPGPDHDRTASLRVVRSLELRRHERRALLQSRLVANF